MTDTFVNNSHENLAESYTKQLTTHWNMRQANQSNLIINLAKTTNLNEENLPVKDKDFDSLWWQYNKDNNNNNNKKKTMCISALFMH